MLDRRLGQREGQGCDLLQALTQESGEKATGREELEAMDFGAWAVSSSATHGLTRLQERDAAPP